MTSTRVREWLGWTIALSICLVSFGTVVRVAVHSAQVGLTNAQLELEEGVRLFNQNEHAKAAEFLTRALAKNLGKSDRSRAREYLVLSYLSLERAADSLEMLILLFAEDEKYAPVAGMQQDIRNLFDQARTSAQELSAVKRRVTDLEAENAKLIATNDARAKELAALVEAKTKVEQQLKNANEQIPITQRSAFGQATALAALAQRRNLTALLGIVWTPIPAGTFEMGCSATDKDCLDNERPNAQVTLEAFQLMSTEVTIGMFSQFAKVPNGRKLNPALDVRKVEHPVTHVTYEDATAFCGWLHARLPTEAEWEYAARARSTTKYFWGDKWEGYRANQGGSSEEVGQPAHRNGFNLHDMLGSVWEWTSSLHYDYPYKVGSGREDDAAKGARVVRGGGWDSDRKLVRVSSRRSGVPPYTPPESTGFRCALSAQAVSGGF